MEFNRDKQIEEMAQDMCKSCRKGICSFSGISCDLHCNTASLVKTFYNAGYRKSTDVAEEIFAEIERALNLSKCYGDSGIYFEKDIETDIAELKKKYIGKDTNVTTNTEEGK